MLAAERAAVADLLPRERQRDGIAEYVLQAYLDEFCFRFNRRAARRRGLLFYRLLEQAVRSEPLRYSDLVVAPGRPKHTPPTPQQTKRVAAGSLSGPRGDHPWRRGQASATS